MIKLNPTATIVAVGFAYIYGLCKAIKNIINAITIPTIIHHLLYILFIIHTAE